MDHEVPQQENPFHAQAQGLGPAQLKTGRDSRLDGLCRQANELVKMASVLQGRSYNLVERLDGARPQNTSGGECAVEQPGYVNMLQGSLTDVRLSLEQVNEHLNDLDTLI